MKLFDVYPLFPIEPVKGEGCTITDKEGITYLDLYGGHAVISIGHSHPHYVKMISDQAANLGFYSNSIQNNLQKELATKLGELSECDNYDLFLCNSGAEANENALKLASFHNGRKRVVAFKKGFHGRTSAAVAVTDNPKIIAPINSTFPVTLVDYNDSAAAVAEIEKGDVCAVIVEGIQGIGGIHVPNAEFLTELQKACNATDTILILDEIQSGYGRSGKFFAFQYTDVKPDLITMAKGMGNGFPIGGVLISNKFKASYGLLGTTFGGNHLGCAAAIAVLDVIKDEKLVKNSAEVGNYLFNELKQIKSIKSLRGQGLMIGMEFEEPIKEIRTKLLFEKKIFTGVSGTHTIRLLPPLGLTIEQAQQFIEALKEVIPS